MKIFLFPFFVPENLGKKMKRRRRDDFEHEKFCGDPCFSARWSAS